MGQNMSTTTRLLLVEDNRIEARQTQHRLAAIAGEAWEVEWVDRLSVALERLSRNEVDLVLLDLNLPDSRGLETLAAIRNESPDVAVIVLTGEEDDATGVMSIQRGATSYLVKHQVDSGTLARTIASALQQRRGHAPVSPGKKSTDGKRFTLVDAGRTAGMTSSAISLAVALTARELTY